MNIHRLWTPTFLSVATILTCTFCGSAASTPNRLDAGFETSDASAPLDAVIDIASDTGIDSEIDHRADAGVHDMSETGSGAGDSSSSADGGSDGSAHGFPVPWIDGPRTVVELSNSNVFDVVAPVASTSYTWTVDAGTIAPQSGTSVTLTAPSLEPGESSRIVHLTVSTIDSSGAAGQIDVPIMVVLTIADSSDLTNNFVFNGTFDLGTSGYEMKKYLRPADNPGGLFDPLGVDDADPSPGGAHALTFTNKYSDAVQILSRSFPLTQGSLYDLSFYMKGSAATPLSVSVGIISADWDVAGGVDAEVTTSWQRFHGTFAASAYSATTKTYTVSVRSNMDGPTKLVPYSLWIDQLKVTPGDIDSPSYAPQAEVEIAVRANAPVLTDAAALTLTVTAANHSAMEVHGSIALVATEDDSTAAPITLDAWPVVLAAGQTLTIAKTESVARYASYTVTPVARFDATSSVLPAWFANVGPYTSSATPIAIDHRFVVGVNEALDPSDGPTGTIAMSNGSVVDYMSELQLMGTRIVRLWDPDPLSWTAVEPNAPNLSSSDNFDFGYGDFIVNNLIDAGIQPLAVLVGGPGLEPYANPAPTETSPSDPNCQAGAMSSDFPTWLTRESAPSPNTSQYYLDSCLQEFLPPNSKPTDAFPYFVSNVVAHFKGRVAYWEINNEANLFSPLGDYVPYLESASTVIHASDPAAKVVGYCFNMGPNTPSAMQGYFGAASTSSSSPGYQGFAASDVMSIHPYSASDLGESDANGSGSIAADVAIANMKQVMDGFGAAAMPLWVTEDYYLSDPNGASTTAAGTLSAVHARHVAQRFLTDLGEGVAQSMPIHSGTLLWKQTLNPEFNRFFTSSWTPSSIFVAYNALARLFEGATPVSKKVWNGSDVCYVVSAPSGPLGACWVYAGGASSGSLTLSVDVDVLDVYGNMTAAGVRTVSLTQTPVYLRSSGPANIAEFEASIAAGAVN